MATIMIAVTAISTTIVATLVAVMVAMFEAAKWWWGCSAGSGGSRTKECKG